MKSIKNVGASLVAQQFSICLASKRYRFDPWSGKIPHASEQLSPCATATEASALEPMLRNKGSLCNEKPMPCNGE